MREVIVQIVIAVIAGNAAVFGFIQFLITRHDQNKKNPDIENIKGAMMSLLAEHLMNSLTKWKHADVRTVDEWNIICSQYKYYRLFGGNSGVEKLFEECQDIPTTE